MTYPKTLNKIPKHIVIEMLQAWKDIFFHQQHADRVIERNLKSHPKWGSRDRRFFAEQVYDGVRWWKKRWYQLGCDPDPDKLLLFWSVGSGTKPDWWDEFSSVPWRSDASLNENTVKTLEDLAIQESFPDWFVGLLANQYRQNDGTVDLNQISAQLKALNDPAPVDLRVNLARISVEKLQAKLRELEVETEVIHGLDSGLTLLKRKNLQSLEVYQQGLFEIQDRASQRIAPMMNIKPGMCVVDACAGAGGKSLHLAELMQNQGQIVSMDVHEFKLKELRQRAHRNGAKIIQTKLIESDKPIQQLVEQADRLLLDVPCSGSGVIRRKPDSKWKLSAAEIDRLTQLQASLLDSYSVMVKPGGLMIYATCSFLKMENQDQVRAFLARAKPGSWQLVDQLSIEPASHQGDGFFAAVLKKI